MRSKRYRKVLAALKPQKIYSLKEAIQILRENNFERSDNLELSLALHWNAKQTGIRGFVFFPYPVKRGKIAVITEGTEEDMIKSPNIVPIKLGDLPAIISKKKKSSWGFNKIIAHSSLADQLRPFAKVLSLKKAFPNYKDGTLTDNLSTSIEQLDKGRMELRSDKGGNFHILIGKSSFENEQIELNFQAVLDKIVSLKPLNWKGEYLKNVTISTAMGPGLKILF